MLSEQRVDCELNGVKINRSYKYMDRPCLTCRQQQDLYNSIDVAI